MTGDAACGSREGVCAIDEREVAERLGKVAELPAGRRVVLLGEQAEIVAVGEQPLEQRGGLVQSAGDSIGIA